MKAPATSRVRPALIVLAALVAGIVITAPFYLSNKEASPGDHVSRMVATHDMAQHLAVMEQFDKVLRTGVLYPRWLPDVNKGYGLPWTNFYPAGFYYVTSLTNALLNDWTYTLFVISSLSLAASALAFYFLSLQFYSPLASAIGALFYMTAPYHVLDLYWRGAMPEFLGFVLVPLIVYFAFKLGAYGRARYYAGLGLVHGLFLMTHIPVAFLMTYALAFLALVWAVRERDLKIAVRIFCGLAIAFAVGAVYLLPAFLETGQAAEHFSAIFPYHKSYITLLKGGDSFADVMNISFASHAVLLLSAVVILHRVSLRSTEENDSNPRLHESQTRLWIVMALATTFMCTSFSIYVSKLLPKIDVASFAWRWLVIAGLFAALVLAAAIDRVRENTTPNTRWLLVCRGSICAAIIFSLAITVHTMAGALSNPRLSPPPDFVEAGFTPKGSTDPHDLPDTPRVVVEPESHAAEIVHWEPNRREVHVEVSEPSRVRFKTYNFPGWLALVDDKPTPMLSDKDGIQIVEVPEGVHRIEASFVNTLPRTAGALLTALGLLGVIGLAAGDRLRESRSAAERTLPASGGPVTTFKALAPVLAPALIGVILLFWLSSRGGSEGAPASGAPAGTSGSAASAGNPGPQTEQGSAILHLDGVPSILIAVDEGALNELMNALPAKDNAKVEALVDSGRLLRVGNDVRVRVLQSAAGKKKVRILEGEYLMAEGWVSERWIR